ncbi:MAG: formate--tetrahydrofolate ligase [Eubacteriaceae bacterium]|nr:formate--tetrahydrofolate ligase [Eubacteriaceae bacterium]
MSPSGKESETIREVILSAGTDFIVSLTATVMRMPELPKVPAAEITDIDEDGRVIGLY